MKPLVTLCKGCGEAALEHRRRAARPTVTCSPECARTWKTSRARASRSKLKAISYLEQALGALEELRAGEPATALGELLDQVRDLKPGELAAPPPGEQPGFPPGDRVLGLRQ